MAKNRCSHTDARTKHHTNYTRLRSLRFVDPPTNSSKKKATPPTRNESTNVIDDFISTLDKPAGNFSFRSFQAVPL